MEYLWFRGGFGGGFWRVLEMGVGMGMEGMGKRGRVEGRDKEEGR